MLQSATGLPKKSDPSIFPDSTRFSDYHTLKLLPDAADRGGDGFDCSNHTDAAAIWLPCCIALIVYRIDWDFITG